MIYKQCNKVIGIVGNEEEERKERVKKEGREGERKRKEGEETGDRLLWRYRHNGHKQLKYEKIYDIHLLINNKYNQ